MVYADEEFYKNEYLLGRKAAISSGFPFYFIGKTAAGALLN